MAMQLTGPAFGGAKFGAQFGATSGRSPASAESYMEPVATVRVSSPFGVRYHPLRRVSHRHNGVDLVAPSGTSVHAAAQGVVRHIGYERRGYGRYVVIDHRYDSETRYAHLSQTARHLRVGMTVEAGEVIGKVGRTGMATGPHLHFELWRYGAPVDPLPLIRESARAAPSAPSASSASSARWYRPPM
ncbi:M23 family metallopeptidase [Pandoraea nosoerga]|nr:M23 family metallopeptidase [Pandoraea nosoerga]